MKKLLMIFSCLCAFMCVFGPAWSYVDRQNAVITILDKASGKTHTMTIPVGQNITYEKLNFVIHTCKQTDPFQAENSYMFIDITTATDGKIFGGWMNKNAPGDNPLQNADYDIWLVRCE